MPIKQNILLTVDAVIFNEPDAYDRSVVLVKRKNDPFKGLWTLPGGFVEDDEDLSVAAARELEEETSVGIDHTSLVQLGAFGTPGRDPRGRAVSVAFAGEMTASEHQLVGADDAEAAEWFPVNDLPELAFDHADIIRAALEKLKV
ncbi:NUDIX domain-containing protein [Fulvivirga ligni]|uniref:NUDIX domain-containing protein n=1 Tax=Fulvivirga ligni TaxID=2904246 RepID=UPI001F43DF2A|nr:NUDIX hydrolase [Fulvivirga ligni]UII20112.1 NUDIX hydrolase [Fulvivirga ligni]